MFAKTGKILFPEATEASESTTTSLLLRTKDIYAVFRCLHSASLKKLGYKCIFDLIFDQKCQFWHEIFGMDIARKLGSNNSATLLYV